MTITYSNYAMPTSHPIACSRALYHQTIETKDCIVSVISNGGIDTERFSKEQAPRILQELGACDILLKINEVAIPLMTTILQSSMVQRMAKGTLTKSEWDEKYMKADALYIHKLGQELTKRVDRNPSKDSSLMKELAEMFLGYGKHLDRLKQYGLSSNHKLISPECDRHINFITQETSNDEFYIAILTDMIPYVVFANYLLYAIENKETNPWMTYATKYGDLNEKYAKEKLRKTILKVNEILSNNSKKIILYKEIFIRGFKFEEWFISHSFSEGHHICDYK